MGVALSLDVLPRRASEDREVYHYLETNYDIGKSDLEEEIKYDLRETKGMEMTMTVFAPKAFRILVRKDSEMINPFESLDPVANAL